MSEPVFSRLDSVKAVGIDHWLADPDLGQYGRAVRLYEKFRKRVESEEYQKQIREESKLGCCIYVIAAGEHLKIGIAIDVKKRLNALRTGHYERLYLLKAWRVESSDMAHFVERRIHRYFAKYRVRGEWFKLPNEQREELLTCTLYPFNEPNIFSEPAPMTDEEADEILKIGPMEYYGIN